MKWDPIKILKGILLTKDFKYGENKMMYDRTRGFEDLEGCKILSVSGVHQDSDFVKFELDGEEDFYLTHFQDCCEWVGLCDVDEYLGKIENEKVLKAEVSTSQGDTENPHDDMGITWTFYKLVTDKGHYTMRWKGESNGYYSEEVHEAWCKKNEQPSEY